MNDPFLTAVTRTITRRKLLRERDSILVAVSWLGRRPGILGPVADSPTARLVRAGGYLVVGAIAVGVIGSMASLA